MQLPDATTMSVGSDGLAASDAAPSKAGMGVKDAADVTKWTTIAIVSVAVLMKRDIGVVLYALGSILNAVVAKVLKRIIREPRPDGAAKSDPGMPSSHATALSFLSVAALLNILAHDGPHPTVRLAAAAAAVAASALASRWRVSAGYHSAPQVLVGWLVGCINAVIWCFLVLPVLRPVLPAFFL